MSKWSICPICHKEVNESKQAKEGTLAEKLPNETEFKHYHAKCYFNKTKRKEKHAGRK